MILLPKISHRKHLTLINNHEAAASTANLMYVSDSETGIMRTKKGKGFTYILEEKIIKDKSILKRIKQLGIPPAWISVWICINENGHLQATGFDVKKRKQYRYHPLWNLLRNETKFHKMAELGKAFPALRLQVEKDLALKDLCEKKVIAAVISLMERTYIRIGNNSYEKLNGSHGITTLHDKHVQVNGPNIQFSFKGKKGIYHDISLRHKKLASIIKECRDIPGKELFQYYDENGQRKSIDSGMVNNYIKTITNEIFTAKDFRTWAGCLHFLLACKKKEIKDNETVAKTSVNELLDSVSKQLGNTRAVCRKYYVHPAIIRLYEEDKLQSYIKELDKMEVNDNVTSLTKEEKILMKVLEKI